PSAFFSKKRRGRRICLNLSIAAEAKSEKVLALDLDHQGSALFWCSWRRSKRWDWKVSSQSGTMGSIARPRLGVRRIGSSGANSSGDEIREDKLVTSPIRSGMWRGSLLQTAARLVAVCVAGLTLPRNEALAHVPKPPRPSSTLPLRALAAWCAGRRGALTAQRLEVGPVGLAMRSLPTLVRQLRIRRVEVNRQHLLGPVRGHEPAIEDSLNDLARMGEILYQQIAVYPIERLGHNRTPCTSAYDPVEGVGDPKVAKHKIGAFRGRLGHAHGAVHGLDQTADFATGPSLK